MDDIIDTIKEILIEQKKLQASEMTTSDLLTRYKIGTGSLGIRQSGCEVWTRGIGSSFILGHTINGLVGSYVNHNLGDSRLGSIIQFSGGYLI